MESYHSQIQWIDDRKETIKSLLYEWVEINSGSKNLKGLEKMMEALKKSFAPLGGSVEEIALKPVHLIDSLGKLYEQPLGKALRIRKREEAPIQILLAGHMDTVYPVSSSFQRAETIDANTLRGPGCADMKGGLVILLKTLEIFEQLPSSSQLGWEVLITPDEELGSPSSEHLFLESAKRVHAALIFEPSFSDGALVSARKGSFNFSIIAHGRTAHAGRDFSSGINAISSLMKCLLKIEKLSNPEKMLTLNIGKIEGGEAVNIVPDLAIGHCNARFTSVEEFSRLKADLEEIIHEENSEGRAKIILHAGTVRMPRNFDERHSWIFEECKECAHQLGYDLTWRPSGGVCDGNLMSNAGIPTIDTLGAIGGNIHTHEEYIKLDSLFSRIKVCILLLQRLSKGIPK